MPSDILTAPEINADSVRTAYILTTKLLHLLDRFEAASIAVLPLKGPVLAQTLYGDTAGRVYEDLDLLVRPKDVVRASELLGECGYQPDSGYAWVPPVEWTRLTWETTLRDRNGTIVDLHWGIAPSDYPFRLTPETMLANAARVCIAGREVVGLNTECLFAYLAIHGAKHAWDHKKWIPDVARVLELNPELDWPRVFALVGNRGGQHVIRLAALLARDLGGSVLPREIEQSIERDAIVLRLADEVKARYAGPAPVSMSGFTYTHFNARLADRMWDKIRHYAGLLKAPTEADLRARRLPVGMFWLYWPLRVARVARKYARGR
ncbi:MAG: nucleotidyltransferase family protein [Bryobacteraceae bacterium]